MPIIGKFSEVADPETGEIEYRGGISFGGVDLPLIIRGNLNRQNENSPPFEIVDRAAGKFADPVIGAGFKNVTQAGDDYIGLKITSSKIGVLNCAMFPGREAGGHVVIWNPRPTAPLTDGAAA